MRGKAERIFKLMTASLAGPYVPNTTILQVRRPFRCDHIRTTVHHALTDIPVITCLEAKERGCDANLKREPKGGNQEHNAEGNKVFFHGHLPEF